MLDSQALDGGGNNQTVLLLGTGSLIKGLSRSLEQEVEITAGNFAGGESVAREVLVSEEMGIYFKQRPERLKLIRSDGHSGKASGTLKRLFRC